MGDHFNSVKEMGDQFNSVSVSVPGDTKTAGTLITIT